MLTVAARLGANARHRFSLWGPPGKHAVVGGAAWRAATSRLLIHKSSAWGPSPER
jgi:hypothetical protein